MTESLEQKKARLRAAREAREAELNTASKAVWDAKAKDHEEFVQNAYAIAPPGMGRKAIRAAMVRAEEFGWVIWSPALHAYRFTDKGRKAAAAIRAGRDPLKE